MHAVKIAFSALLVGTVWVADASAGSSGSSVTVGVSTSGSTSSFAGAFAGSNSMAASTGGSLGISGTNSATSSLSGTITNQGLVGAGHSTLSVTVNGQTMTQNYSWSSF